MKPAVFTHIVRVILLAVVCADAGQAQQVPIQFGSDGRLEYKADEQGERILDFSSCGYRGSNHEIPDVDSRVIVRPSGDDDTARIQAAIDVVSQLDVQPNGFRGAVQLGDGEFFVSGQLVIATSGVVVRGVGAGEGGTIIRATGQGRRSLIVTRTADDSATVERAPSFPIPIVDAVVPAGATRVRLSSTAGLTVGQRVEIVHPSTPAWIEVMGGDRFGWRAGTRDLRWERTVTAIDGEQIELDAPLTMAIDRQLSQATVVSLHRPEALANVGIEDLTLISDYDPQNPRDEEHAWFGIDLPQVRDAWVRRVEFRHFAGGAVILGDRSARVSIVDCASFAPISELGGYRRHTFVTLGQQCLFLRCWSESGIHDFSVGHLASGPNAFVNCYAAHALGGSGPYESCAVGVLYDNVRIDGNDLNLMNRWNSPPKAGWSAINCVLWQCQAANVHCQRPPLGGQWALGIWATPAGDGYFAGLSDFVQPISLFQQQLRDRLGDEAADRVGPFLLNPEGATNPTLAQAAEFTARSRAPARQLIDLIRERWQGAGGQRRRQVSSESVPELDLRQLPSPATADVPAKASFAVTNGWLTVDGRLLTGGHYTPSWWRGELDRARAEAMGPAITRFAPGRQGTGLTDDLTSVAEMMSRSGFGGYDHHYGLWYDRRRDDHLMVRRADAEVIPPFYEQPFARSGRGTAWDGLSLYDLSKYNSWYWSRLREFAELGQHHRFVLFHHHFFQHNILEAGAHWADSPWRPANQLNETGLPEPPPYVGDKRIFLAERFYDASNQPLRDLQRGYIHQCLDNFVGQDNVIQLTSGEFTGPLSFAQFWFDTIAQWRRDAGKKVVVGLSCTKDVQDAILEDPQRAPQVDVIDIRYWTYTEDGGLYAPRGGVNLAPRQHLRQLKPAAASYDSIVRSVKQYRKQFPEKAVTYYANLYCRAERDGWAILFGGGSLPNVPLLPDALSRAIVAMQPSDPLGLGENANCLAGEGQYLIDWRGGSEHTMVLPAGHAYEWVEIDRASGRLVGEFASLPANRLPVPRPAAVLWVRDRGGPSPNPSP